MATRNLATGFKWVRINIIICLMFFSDPVVPSSNIVKSLPGFPGSLPFKLETEYIAVDEKEDVQYFYYFVESEGNPRKDPLMLWFFGGPGCSGLSSLLFEIGPIRFNSIKYNGSLPALELNPHSWTKVASIIFIDAPAGSGFSYSTTWEGSQTGDREISYHGFIFLKKWLLAHPRFISNPLYLGGESYGGFIVPTVAINITKSIEASHTPKLNFQGYLLGNPLTDYTIDRSSIIPFAHRMALISDELYESTKKTCKGQYYGNHSDNAPCANDLNAISQSIENLNDGQILEPKCRSIFTTNGNMEETNTKSLLEMQSDPKLVPPNLNFEGPPLEFHESGCPNLALIHFWANDKAVQRALHIREGTIKQWIRCPKNLPFKIEVESVLSYHQHLNSQGHRALIYSGDHDMIIPYIGTQAWIKTLDLPIVGRRWSPWLVDGELAGYVTEYSNGLTFTTVKGGGHTVPEYRPKECFAMFKRWISQEPL